MSEDRVVFARVLANGPGGITADIEGVTYGPGLGLRPDLSPGDMEPIAYLHPGSSRQPVSLGQSPRLIEIRLPSSSGGTGTSLGSWYQPEGQASLPYGIYARVAPYPLSGTSGNLWSLARTADSSSVDGNTFRGRLDPLGIVNFSSYSTRVVGIYAPIYGSNSSAVTNSLQIVELFNPGAFGGGGYNSYPFSYPATRAEKFVGGFFQPSGPNFDADALPSLFYIPNSNTDAYIIPTQCGICSFQRNGQVVTWSPHIADTLRFSRGPFSVASDTINDNGPNQGMVPVLEGSFLSYSTAENDNGVAASGPRATMYLYFVDLNTDLTQGQAIPQPPISLLSLTPGGALKIYGTGISSGAFDVDSTSGIAQFQNNFQSGGGPYVDWQGNGFTGPLTPGTGNASLAYSTAPTTNVIGGDYQLPVKPSRWPEHSAQHSWWIYLNSLSQSGPPAAVPTPYLQIVAVDQQTRALTIKNKLTPASLFPVDPYPGWRAAQIATIVAAANASRSATPTSITGTVAYAYCAGDVWVGDQLKLDSGGSVVAAPPEEDLGRDIKYLVFPMASDFDELSMPQISMSKTTTTDQSCAGVFDATQDSHFIAVGEPVLVAYNYTSYPLAYVSPTEFLETISGRWDSTTVSVRDGIFFYEGYVGSPPVFDGMIPGPISHSEYDSVTVTVNNPSTGTYAAGAGLFGGSYLYHYSYAVRMNANYSHTAFANYAQSVISTMNLLLPTPVWDPAIPAYALSPALPVPTDHTQLVWESYDVNANIQLDHVEFWGPTSDPFTSQPDVGLYANGISGSSSNTLTYRTLLVVTPKDGSPGFTKDISQKLSWTGESGIGDGRNKLVQATDWLATLNVWQILSRGQYLFVLRQYIPNFVHLSDYTKRTPHVEIYKLVNGDAHYPSKVTDLLFVTRFNLQPTPPVTTPPTVLLPRYVHSPRMLIDVDLNGNPFVEVHSEWVPSTWTSGDDGSVRRQAQTLIQLAQDPSTRGFNYLFNWSRTDNLSPPGYTDNSPTLVELSTAAVTLTGLISIKDGQNVVQF